MAMVIIRYKGEVFASRQAKLFGTFVVFTGVGILWAVVRSYVPLALRYHVDYFGLFIITAFIVDSPRRARVLAHGLRRHHRPAGRHQPQHVRPGDPLRRVRGRLLHG